MDSLVEGELTLQIRARNLSPAAEAGLKQWASQIRHDDGQLHLTIQSEVDLPVINRYLVEQGAEVYAFSPQKVSLEDLFLQVVGDAGE
jgi:ABC-type uncharacterized transport system ATPase subunit